MSKVLDHVKPSERISDLERILALAEDLQDKSRFYSQRIEMYRAAQIILGGGGIFLLSWLTVRGALNPLGTSQLYLIMIMISLFAYAVALEYLIRKLKRRTLPDRLALAELVELLRETESALGERENWSTLDRAQFRIRLSRFGIGPGHWPT